MNSPVELKPDRFKQGTLLVATVGFLLFAAWLVTPAGPAGFDWDDTWYIWMAEWFSGRVDYQSITLSMLQARQYPPLFPFVLSLTGDVLADISVGLLMNMLFLAIGTGLLMKWLISERLPLIAAVAGGALFMFNPVALTFIPTLMAEPLFILLTVSALLIAHKGSGTLSTWVLVGLLAGLSVATRSAGWALVAAFVIQLLMQRKPNLLVYYLPGVALGLLVIAYLNAGLPQAHSYFDGFIENMARIDVSYLFNQMAAMVVGWNQIWGSVAGGIIAALLFFPGLFIRIRHFRADALYIVVSFCMLLAWPFPGQMGRFLWALVPAFLLAMISTFDLLADKKRWPQGFAALLVLVLALSIPDGAGRAVTRLLDPPGGELTHLSRLSAWTRSVDRESGVITLKVRQQFLNDMERISKLVDSKFCIYSELPAMVSLQAKKVSFATPWNSPNELSPEKITCAYYYQIPSAVPGATAQGLAQFSGQHQELFRSLAPWDKSGETLLGVFYVLFPETNEL